MPKRVYRPTIHRSRCSMRSEMRLKRTEKSSMKEWLSSTMKDLKSYSRLKSYCQNHQSHKISWWCFKITWLDWGGPLVRWRKNCPKSQEKMTSLPFTRDKQLWSRRRRNRHKSSLNDRNKTCQGYKGRLEKSKSKSTKLRALGSKRTN